MRFDLIALTSDDLITLSNRGLLKRAQQELALPDLKGEIAEDESGNIKIDWSDDICCQFPAQKTLAQSYCSCPASSLCRHLLRSLLFYQCQISSQGEASPAPLGKTAWNPGTISDRVLQTHYSKLALTKLRSQFDAGQVIKVITGIEPRAHFHSLSLNLRFLIPDDLRYTHCDCDELAPCSHVPLAIWAFRKLPPEESQGIISTAAESIAVPTALLDEVERLVVELADVGIAGINSVLRDRFSRLEQQCRRHELVWIAEILLDIIQSCSYYHQHDARFDIQQVVSWIGELLIRSDAIRHHAAWQNPIPLLFIKGSTQDKTVALGSARLMGLGCGVTVRSSGVKIAAYLQDLDSGTVMAMTHYFANPEPPIRPKDFWQLAQVSMGKGMQLGAIGAGQILIKGGKRTPSYRLIPGRSPMSLNPQSCQWEKLRSPLLVHSFTDLIARLRELPLPELQPRRMTEQLQVLTIGAVEFVEFDPIGQAVRAIVVDSAGTPATLIQPYLDRGRFGIEAMLTRLQQEELKFVSARVSLSAAGLVLEPVALIFQSGETRQMLQPWVASPQVTLEKEVAPQLVDRTVTSSPIALYLQDIQAALQNTWLVGLQRADRVNLQQWQQLVRQGEAIGFSSLLPSMQNLIVCLSDRFHSLNWNSQPAREALALVTVLSQVSSHVL
jgi:hypothetical protein